MKQMMILTLMLTLSSCATLFSDSSDELTIDSEPSGATVYLQGERIGETPLKYRLDRETFIHYGIRLQKEGYETKSFKVNKTFNKVAILNLTSVLSWATDALSGNMIEYAPKSYYVELEKKGVTQGPQGPSARLFVWGTKDLLLRDMARGEGQYLDAFLELAHVPAEKKEQVTDRLKDEIASLKSLPDRRNLYQRLDRIVSRSM